MKSLIIITNKRLGELESIISKNLKAFYEVGSALMEIRESKLYKQDYDTFEAYCRDRWDMTRQYAYNLIGSSEVVDNLKNVNNCLHIPASESQARPLTRLSAPLQQEVWQRVVDTAPEGKITARYVAKVVSETKKENVKKEVDEKAVKIKSIQKEELTDEDFRRAFDAFYREVQRARLDNWKTIPKETALRFVILVQDLIEVK